MRLGNLILWDIKFQIKYGFYMLYGILTVLYLVALFALPETWRENAVTILIFSDPATMGLFFMGAIILLEKSQQMPSAFAVSPLSAFEYIIAKVASLCAISLVVATILAFFVTADNLLGTLLGTLLSSIIFTLIGIIIATKITSLNQFILWTVPIELIGFVPAILHLFKLSPIAMRFYPINVCLDLIAGKEVMVIGLFGVAGLIIILFVITYKCVLKM